MPVVMAAEYRTARCTVPGAASREAVEDLHLPAFVSAEICGEGPYPRCDHGGNQLLGAQDARQERVHDGAEVVVLGTEPVEIGFDLRMIPGQESKMTFLSLKMALEAGTEMMELAAKPRGPGPCVAVGARIQETHERRDLLREIAMLVFDGTKHVGRECGHVGDHSWFPPRGSRVVWSNATSMPHPD
jgi:hypothetical protein